MAFQQTAILVIDDDEPTRSMLIEALAYAGGRSITAVADGASALAVLDTTRPDLMVLNITLPDIDGATLYRMVRQRADLASVPVLFMSALSAKEIHEHLDDLKGCYRWLPKPFDLDVLDATIEGLLSDDRN